MGTSSIGGPEGCYQHRAPALTTQPNEAVAMATTPIHPESAIWKHCAHCAEPFPLAHNSQKHCSVECRFDAMTERNGPGGCWQWLGSKHPFGHGYFGVGRKVVYAHRFAWEQHNGPIPGDMCVCHTCDNPACVNPEHLFLGTRADNLADMRAKGRNAPMPHVPGERHGCSKLTDDAVRHIRSSGEPAAALARLYGVDPQTIYSVRRRSSWRHIP